MKKIISLMLIFVTSLAFAETNIYKSFILYSDSFKNIEIKSEDSTPIDNGSGSGSQNPEKNSASAVINITTDNYSEETSVKITNLDTSNVFFTKTYTVNDSNSNLQEVIEINIAGEYLFEILDGFGDGICCLEGNGDYSFDIDSTHVNDGGEYNFGEYTYFTINNDFSVTVGSTGIYNTEEEALNNNNNDVVLNVPINYNVTTDKNAEQTTFYIFNETDNYIFLDTPTFPNAGISFTMNDSVPIISPGTYVFNIYDSAGDGLGTGSYSLYFNTNFLNGGYDIKYGAWTRFIVDDTGQLTVIGSGLYNTAEEADSSKLNYN